MPFCLSQSLPGVSVARAPSGSASVFSSRTTGGSPARSVARPGSDSTALSSAVSLRPSSSRSWALAPVTASTSAMDRSPSMVLNSCQPAESSASEKEEV